MSDAETSLDLDGLINEPVHFRLHGQDRVIKVIDVITSFKFTKAIEAISFHKEKKSTTEQMLKDYFSIFESCVEPFTMEDLLRMKMPQLVSLYGLIIRRMFGEDLAATYDQKKTPKILKTPPSQSKSIRKRSLLKRLFFSDGSQKSV